MLKHFIDLTFQFSPQSFLRQMLSIHSINLFKISVPFILLLFNLSTSLVAQDGSDPQKKISDQPTVDEKVSVLDKQIETTLQQENSLRSNVVEIRKQLTDIDREWQDLAGQMEKIQAEQKKLGMKFKEQLDAADQANKKYEEAQKAAEAAQKLAEYAIKKAEEQKRLAKAAFEESEKLAVIPIETKQAIAKLEDKIPTIKKLIGEKKTIRDSVLGKIAGFQQQVDLHNAERNAATAKIESLLKQSGQWVSFAEQIAPIFHQRCIACHNSKTAQGRYNMKTYSDIMSGGESGAAIDPGDAEFSSLCIMIEDGSMPKDSDLLTNKQIESIKQWVNLGARLDHDVDPQESLIRIMPREQQPTPPETYRVALPVTALAIHPDNQMIASSGYHEVLLWSLEGELLKRLNNVAERVHGLAFHPDGSQIAVATGTPGRLGEVKIFAVDSGELLYDLYIAEDSMFSVDWSSSGKQLAASGADRTIVVFDFEKDERGKIKRHVISDHADWVNSIEWSNDDQKLVSASRDKTAKVFDATTGKLLLTFNKHGNDVYDARWVRGSQHIASLGGDQRMRIWNSIDGKEIRTIKFPAIVSQIAMLKNQQSISGGVDADVRFHNLDDGKQIQEQHLSNDWISSLAISEDQKFVVVGDQSGEITLQDISDVQKNQKEFTQRWTAVPH